MSLAFFEAENLRRLGLKLFFGGVVLIFLAIALGHFAFDYYLAVLPFVVAVPTVGGILILVATAISFFRGGE